MSTDASALKRRFPLLRSQARLHYLDSAATSQIVDAALEAAVRHDTTCRANVLRGTYALAEAADAAYEEARAAVARFLNAGSADEVVFTSGATAALNLVAHAFGGSIAPGDAIVVSVAEHHSNLVPWQMLAQRRGIDLRALPITPDGRLDLDRLPELLDERCRLLALTHCSNVTGAITDVDRVVSAARRLGIPVLLDGAQAAQHGPLDVRRLGVDFYVFSGHKCFGPTGVGALWATRAMLDAMPPFLGGGGMVGQVTIEHTTYAPPPRRFEAGTPPIAQAVGMGAALDWMRTLDWTAIREREAALARRLIEGLDAMPAVRILGPADSDRRAPIVSFAVAGVHPHDLTQLLDESALALRGGHHCAQPLMAALGVETCTRASIALYNDQADIDALLGATERAIGMLR
jgi:cysteine desulfurase/selenocysteine lyase